MQFMSILRLPPLERNKLWSEACPGYGSALLTVDLTTVFTWLSIPLTTANFSWLSEHPNTYSHLNICPPSWSLSQASLIRTSYGDVESSYNCWIWERILIVIINPKNIAAAAIIVLKQTCRCDVRQTFNCFHVDSSVLEFVVYSVMPRTT